MTGYGLPTYCIFIAGCERPGHAGLSPIYLPCRKKTMPIIKQNFLGFCCLLLLLSACASSQNEEAAFKGINYPPTSQVRYIFQPGQADPACRIFAQALVSFPAGTNGAAMRQQLGDEAKKHGAEMVLIGQSRQMEEANEMQFIYYGPNKEYLCNTQWCGWKFGYDIWDEQGNYVNIGYKEWGNSTVQFAFPVLLQAAYLRCQ